MVAGLGTQTKSIEYRPTSVSKGTRNQERNRVFDERKLPPNAHCSPERSYVLRPQICYSGSSVYSELPARDVPNQQCVAGILDTFACLCLGSTDVMGVSKGDRSLREKHRSERRRKSRSTSGKKVIYPIASYAVRLNSKRLVDQRRKSLPHHFFRPVVSDDMSSRPRTA